jgi:hypothetical protein
MAEPIAEPRAMAQALKNAAEFKGENAGEARLCAPQPPQFWDAASPHGLRGGKSGQEFKSVCLALVGREPHSVSFRGAAPLHGSKALGYWRGVLKLSHGRECGAWRVGLWWRSG